MESSWWVANDFGGLWSVGVWHPLARLTRASLSMSRPVRWSQAAPRLVATSSNRMDTCANTPCVSLWFTSTAEFDGLLAPFEDASPHTVVIIVWKARPLTLDSLACGKRRVCMCEQATASLSDRWSRLKECSNGNRGKLRGGELLLTERLKAASCDIPIHSHPLRAGA
jgi:hypothetical protein